MTIFLYTTMIVCMYIHCMYVCVCVVEWCYTAELRQSLCIQYICMYTWMYVFMYVCIVERCYKPKLWQSLCIQQWLFVCMYVCMYMYVCMCMRRWVVLYSLVMTIFLYTIYMHVNMNVCFYVCVYIFMYVCVVEGCYTAQLCHYTW